MWNQRWRPVVISAVVVVALWVVALVGYSVVRNARVTADKVRHYVESVSLEKLSGKERAEALNKLAKMLNALPYEERRKTRLERLAWGWFDQMTEQERASFIDATMPTGFKQMLTSFEQLPEDKRRKTVDDALKRLRAAQTKLQGAAEEGESASTNAGPVLSPELEARVRTIGLSTFYSQSSAQTKAELAPVLEELQRVMESGRPFRPR
jgi:hypothetical protein